MLVMDSIFKFMSTRSCLERMDELKKNANNEHRWQQLVKQEFAGQSIVASWGNQRTYIVSDIDFATNPIQQTFNYNGTDIPVAEYFENRYKMHVTKPNQPLFEIKQGDNNKFYLPPEFCFVDGVSDEIRKSPGMRTAL